MLSKHAPIINPRNPSQPDSRCNIGLSRTVEIFAPILWRNEINVKVTKKSIEKDNAMAMKTGVVAVGADNRRSGAPSGSTVVSIRGFFFSYNRIAARNHTRCTRVRWLGLSRLCLRHCLLVNRSLESICEYSSHTLSTKSHLKHPRRGWVRQRSYQARLLSRQSMV